MQLSISPAGVTEITNLVAEAPGGLAALSHDKNAVAAQEINLPHRSPGAGIKPRIARIERIEIRGIRGQFHFFSPELLCMKRFCCLAPAFPRQPSRFATVGAVL